MKTIRRQVGVLVAVVIVLSMIAPVQALAARIGANEISSAGACVIDFETGIMLYGHNADTPRVPASMVKLVSVYVAYDEIKAGRISLDDVTRISTGASELSFNLEYSNVPFHAGTQVTIRQLIDFIIIWSAAGATVALGEALFGSEQALIARMNDLAARLGIEARFLDSYGVSASNNISPHGMAILSRHLIIDHPEILQVTTKSSVTFEGTEYKNTNNLLGEYAGVDGLKTGFTNAAGFCFVGTAQQGGRRIIAVTMGSTHEARFPDTRILLNYGFLNAERIIAEAADVDDETADVDDKINDEEDETADVDDNTNDGDGETINVVNKPIVRGKTAPSTASLILNGVDIPLTAYMIGGNHFFRLRDIANMMIGTQFEFDVVWEADESIVRIMTGTSYSAADGVLTVIGEAERDYITSPSRFFLDGVEHELDVFTIEGSNYFRLRDFERLIGFRVYWVGEIRTVIVNTIIGFNTPGNPDAENGELGYGIPVNGDSEHDS